MRNFFQFPLIVLLLIFCGCATTSAFHEPNETTSHATLIFESYMGIGNAMGVCEINGLPPDSWKINYHKFLVPPGHVTVLVDVIRQQVGGNASDLIKIDAEDGHTYYFSRDVHNRIVTFIVKKDNQDIVYSHDVELDSSFGDGTGKFF